MGNIGDVKKVKDFFENEVTELYYKNAGRSGCFTLEAGRVYIIPGYQREIRWSSENVQVLISDLSHGKKFLGTISLSTSKPAEFEVIDGQQRITVISLMLFYLNSVVPANKKTKDLCEIVNESFPKFEEAKSEKFDYERIKSSNLALYNQILSNDPLNQCNTFKNIWDCIVETISPMQPNEKVDLITALTESDINVLVNAVDDTPSSKKFCVDYFIDINNKSVVLDKLDIIRAYAFKDDFNKMTSRWVAIQNKCNALLEKDVLYPREALFYHYFVCKVNCQVDNKLTGLKENYTTKESISFGGKKYSKGSYIWNIFSKDEFYSTMLVELDEFLDFIEWVLKHEDGGAAEFKEYFRLEDDSLSDETRILNAFLIISSIIRNDDIVPKMMVLKYYLDVMKAAKAKKGVYKSIYAINALAVIFSAGSKDKGSDFLVSKVIKENWVQALNETCAKQILELPDRIDFSKPAVTNKKVTNTSGQYMARRFLTLMDTYSSASGNYNVNEEEFKNINVSTGQNNMEHFLINRKWTYTLYNVGEKGQEIEINLPRGKKNIGVIANYLLLDSKVNRELANRPAFEKIQMINEKIAEKGFDAIIPSKYSQLVFRLMEYVFLITTSYPYKQLNNAKSKKDKKTILRKYYKEDFEKELHKLEELLPKTKSMADIPSVEKCENE